MRSPRHKELFLSYWPHITHMRWHKHCTASTLILFQCAHKHYNIPPPEGTACNTNCGPSVKKPTNPMSNFFVLKAMPFRINNAITLNK